MPKLLRPLLLSLMLGLLDAMRRAEDPNAAHAAIRWVMHAPVDRPLPHPARCWFWNQSSLAN